MPNNQRQLNGGVQGPGSGLDADQVDGKESADLGASADGTTIVKDSNGDFTVEKPSSVVIGNFENGLDNWTVDAEAEYDYVRTDTGQSIKGSQSLYCEGDSSSYARAEIAVDLTGIGEIRFWWWVDGDTPNAGLSDQPGTGVGNVKNVTGDDSNISQMTWQEIVWDVSDLTGTYYLFNAGHDYHWCYMDYVRLVKSPKEVVGDNVV